MWLNHSKYCGFGEFSLFQKSQILGDFGVDIGVVLGALGITFGPLGSFCGHLGVRKSVQKKHGKKVQRRIPGNPD